MKSKAYHIAGTVKSKTNRKIVDSQNRYPYSCNTYT